MLPFKNADKMSRWPVDALPEELFQTLLTTTNVRIERIISHGHASLEGFWYDQHTHERALGRTLRR